MNISTRAAKIEDLPVLLELVEMLFAIESDFEFDSEKVERGLRLFLLHRDAREIFVAENEAQILGMASVQLLISTAEGAPSGWIEDVILQPQSRGQGVGSQLLGAIENWCQARGATRLQLVYDGENSPALSFYQKFGFAPTKLKLLTKSLARD